MESGDGESGARLVANSDLAMYRAKADVTRVVCFYEPKMDEAARYRNALGLELRKAVELNQFELHSIESDLTRNDIPRRSRFRRHERRIRRGRGRDRRDAVLIGSR